MEFVSGILACPVFSAICGITQGIANSAFQAVVSSMVDAASRVVKALMTFWLKAPTPDVTSATGVTFWVNDNLRWLTSAVAVFAVLVGAIKVALSQRPDAGFDTLRMLVRVLVTGAVTAPLVAVLLSIGDDVSSQVLSNTDAAGLGRVAVGGLGPGLSLIGALLIALTSLFQLLIMIMRGAVVAILVGMLPLAAASSNTAVGRAWFTKSCGWLGAFVAVKPASALIYAVGMKEESSTTSTTAVLSGMFVLVLAVFALPVLLKVCVAFTGALGSNGGGSMTLAAAGAAATGAVALAGGGITASGGGGAARGGVSGSRGGSSGGGVDGGGGGGVFPTGIGPGGNSPSGLSAPGGSPTGGSGGGPGAAGRSASSGGFPGTTSSGEGGASTGDGASTGGGSMADDTGPAPRVVLSTGRESAPSGGSGTSGGGRGSGGDRHSGGESQRARPGGGAGPAGPGPSGMIAPGGGFAGAGQALRAAGSSADSAPGRGAPTPLPPDAASSGSVPAGAGPAGVESSGSAAGRPVGMGSGPSGAGPSGAGPSGAGPSRSGAAAAGGGSPWVFPADQIGQASRAIRGGSEDGAEATDPVGPSGAGGAR